MGWQTPKEYVDMATDPARRETFVQSVVDFVGENNFDGFHLHWGSPGSAEIDQNEARTHLTILLKELKTALTATSKTLSIAIWSPLASKLNNNFEISEVYKQADLVFVMAFGYSGRWFKNTGAFAPLYPGEDTMVPEEEYLTVDSSWRHMKKRGALPEKTVLVVSPKGNSFKLNEICNLVAGPSSDWIRVWDGERKVPYMYKGEEWVSYEDEESVKEEAKYRNEEGLAGLGFNNLAYDDFDGRCNSSSNTFPLLRIGKEELAVPNSATIPTGHSQVLLLFAVLSNFVLARQNLFKTS